MKNVLITGASRGIGLALTKEFLENGFRVLGTYRHEKTASELLNLALESPHLLTVKADVSDILTLSDLKNELKKMGSLDILINNSGVNGEVGRSVLELDLDIVSGVFNVNTLGPLRVTQAVLPFMSKQGAIVQITSKMGSITENSGDNYDYRMSKAALNMFNSCLAKEFPKLTCLVLHPGWVQTDMGGPRATVTVQDSATGLYKVITESTLQKSGQFFDFMGHPIPW